MDKIEYDIWSYASPWANITFFFVAMLGFVSPAAIWIFYGKKPYAKSILASVACGLGLLSAWMWKVADKFDLYGWLVRDTLMLYTFLFVLGWVCIKKKSPVDNSQKDA